jgi:integrase
MNRPRKNKTDLPPCVFFKHGAHWYVKRGKWKRLPEKGPSTLSAALEAYASIIEAPRGGMDKLIDDAFDAMRPGLKPNSIKAYTLAARRLKEILAEFAPDQVRGKHVAAIKKSMAKKPGMANQVISFGKQVFAYALEEEVPGVENNPFVGIRRHRQKARDRLISAEEYTAVYAHANDRLQIVMDLCRLTGQRITAVLRIRRIDLLPEGIRFPQHKTEAKRTVKWNAELRAVVDRAKTLHGNLTALTLIHNRRGKVPAYQTVREQWTKACRAAGIENAHLHDLRAVAATTAKRQGKNATELLAHTTAAQTQRYLRGREEVLVEGPSFVILDSPIDGAKKDQ